MIVLGHDPSLACYGLALVDSERMALLASAVIKTSGRMPRADRLYFLRRDIAEYTDLWGMRNAIDAVAFEGGFLGRGAQVSLGIAEARGAALSVGYGVPVTILSPCSAKMAVTGRGNAKKYEVQAAVAALLGSVELSKDEADACAVAIAAGGYRAPRPDKRKRGKKKVEA